jgi:hypothetical protein
MENNYYNEVKNRILRTAASIFETSLTAGQEACKMALSRMEENETPDDEVSENT